MHLKILKNRDVTVQEIDFNDDRQQHQQQQQQEHQQRGRHTLPSRPTTTTTTATTLCCTDDIGGRKIFSELTGHLVLSQFRQLCLLVVTYCLVTWFSALSMTASFFHLPIF